MSNVLIVESKNDKVFVQALVEHLNLHNIEFDEPICQIDDYECLGGLDPKRLTTALQLLKEGLSKEEINIQGIGIILDDDGQRAKRMTLINNAVKEVFETDVQFSHPGELITVSITTADEMVNLKLACFLTNVAGQGELETVLKAIKTQPSDHADCLESWRSCLLSLGETITAKEFDKFWISNYLRFDTCSKLERQQVAKKCSMSNFEYIMGHKRDIWNFDHPALNEFKAFLHLFNE